MSESRRHGRVRNAPPELSVVVPLFNEEANLPDLHARLVDTLVVLDLPFELVFVDDGSRDRTPALLRELHRTHPSVTVVGLSRNFGHQAAVSAGLELARGRCVVVMDGDLQDPPEVLPRFLERWRDGFDVVYAIRTERKEQPFLRLAYFAFYRILRAISDLDIPLDSGDFCLMDRKVVDALNALPERARFVRGLRTFVGFRQTGLVYERAARASGKPKYTFRKLLALAIDGVVSFSNYPLRLLTYTGIATVGVASGLTIWALTDALYQHTAPRGWASVIITVLFLSAIQMIGLGIIGEYLRLIFLEAKGRPFYIVGNYQPQRGEGAGEEETPRTPGRRRRLARHPRHTERLNPPTPRIASPQIRYRIPPAGPAA